MNNNLNNNKQTNNIIEYKQPRVLFLTGVLWGENGITSHLLTLAQGLIKSDWQVAIASDIPSDINEAKQEANKAIELFKAYGINHFLIPFTKPSFSAKTIRHTFNFLVGLDAVLRQFKPDIIHVHSLSVCPYLQLVRVIHNIPFVSTCHLEPSINSLEIKVSMWANKFLNNQFLGNRVIAISSELKEVFEHTIKVPQTNIRLNYHGVDQQHFRQPSLEERCISRETFNIASSSNVVCLIGRLSSVKGHDVLIKALAILKSQGVKVILLCAGMGYGNEQQRILSQAEDSGVLDLIRLTGYTDSRQVYWASDINVLPSRREGFGLVVVEAMLCGIVSIRTPTAGAIDQIEDGVNGFIVAFDNPQMLSSRLKQLLQDNKLKEQMSSIAMQSARIKFSNERMVKDTISIYQEVIKEANYN